MFKEFKTFIMRGNVMDLAVGVIVGAAFSKIVTSLVNDILMPLLGIVLGKVDFTKLTIGSVKYGMFIQNIVDFLIVAFCIFLMVKVINKIMKKQDDDKKEEKPVKSDELKTLEEIRDLLKKKNK